MIRRLSRRRGLHFRASGVVLRFRKMQVRFAGAVPEDARAALARIRKSKMSYSERFVEWLTGAE